MPSDSHAIHATGEDESRELRFTRNEDGPYQCVIWWNRGDKRLATMNFPETETDGLREWLNEPNSAGLLKK